MRPLPDFLKSITKSAVLGVVALSCSTIASAQDRIALARDYLVQKVCADSDDKGLPVDPYRCEPPNHLRNLRVSEAPPYHRVDQLGVQRHDAYPVKALDGSEIIVNPFDFAPVGSPGTELEFAL